MIRKCLEGEFEDIYAVVNDAASAYSGAIPRDRYKEPYMSREELRREMDEGVVFWGCEEGGALMGVMGIQQVQDVTVIRHAYVRTGIQKKGVGSRLLKFL